MKADECFCESCSRIIAKELIKENPEMDVIGFYDLIKEMPNFSYNKQPAKYTKEYLCRGDGNGFDNGDGWGCGYEINIPNGFLSGDGYSNPAPLEELYKCCSGFYDVEPDTDHFGCGNGDWVTGDGAGCSLEGNYGGDGFGSGVDSNGKIKYYYYK